MRSSIRGFAMVIRVSLACAAGVARFLVARKPPVACAAGCKRRIDSVRLRGGRLGWIACVCDAAALRRRRQGSAAPPAPPAQGVAPGNPNSTRSHGEGQARMLTGRSKPAAADAHFWHNRSMRRWINRAASIICRGLGGGSPAQWGARGAEPARIHVAM